MGFIIWYKIEIAEATPAGGLLAAAASLLGLGLPLQVSNDVFSGQYILDADITLTMPVGALASTFSVKLNNLPKDLAALLKSKQAEGLQSGKPLRVKVSLGYFEDAPTFKATSPVMEGVVLRLKNSIDDSGMLITEIQGEELGGYQLRTHCVSWSQEGPSQADAIVQSIASQTGIQPAPNSNLAVKPLPNFTLRADSGLEGLRRIASHAQVPLVIRDNKIYIGPSVGADNAPEPFDPDTNIVRLDEAQESEEIPEPCAQRQDGQVRSTPRTSFELTVLGIPGLRVGQRVTFKNQPDVPAGPLRISHLVHHFSTNSGYTCQVTVVAAEPGQQARGVAGASGVVSRIRDLTEHSQDQRPAVDIGEVTQYAPGKQQKHLATLNYAQSPPPDTVAPSVETTVDTAVQLKNKPILSPFAFHKCGLMVPVYSKMRALLAHNRGLVNDALVSGFLWSENPLYEPPQNEPGDYWLCLPTQLGADNLPTGKGVNDLTDSTGRRVIQAKGLHIVVGTDKLPDVGVRPTVPSDLDNQIIIEHKSGTKITITSDGAVQIETTNKDIALTNGSVALKLSGAAVEVS